MTPTTPDLTRYFIEQTPALINVQNGILRGLPDGKYEITATSTWNVHYESTTGIEGDLPTTRTSTTSLQTDEIQVLTGS